MNFSNNLTIERKHEVLDRLKLSKTTLQNKIHDGLWCPPISIGERAVGFIKHETDALLSAYSQGYSKSQIRQLVQSLVEQRKAYQGGL